MTAVRALAPVQGQRLFQYNVHDELGDENVEGMKCVLGGLISCKVQERSMRTEGPKL